MGFVKKPGQLPNFDQNSEYWRFHSFCLLKTNAPGLPSSAHGITCLKAALRWRSRWGPPQRRGRWSVGLSSRPHTPGSTARERPMLRHSYNAAPSLVQHRGCWLETTRFHAMEFCFPYPHFHPHWHYFLGQGHCWNTLLKAQEKERKVIVSPGNSRRPKHQQLSDSAPLSLKGVSSQQCQTWWEPMCAAKGLPWTCFQYNPPIMYPSAPWTWLSMPQDTSTSEPEQQRRVKNHPS